ncbi:MAG: endo alpha-1,4 polygalactosaminidase, partial [Thermomicrobiales bacterium]
ASTWKPEVATSWQIQYAALPVDRSISAQMYDLDLFTTDPGTIASLHGSGRRVACYFSAGSYEPYRPDSDQFPAAVRGKSLKGFADEQWLDIRRLDVLGPIMRARLDLCKQKGFDAVDPDNVDGYNNPTGFPLTAQDQLTFNRWLAREAHARGLAVFLKNDGDQVRQLVDSFDGAVVEQCFEYAECTLYQPFVQAGKPVFEIEYNMEPGAFCAQANALNFNSLYKHLSLDAYRVACR